MIISDIVAGFIILYSTVFIIIVARLQIRYKRQGTDFSGLVPINKTVYNLGKVCSLLTWAAMIVQALGYDIRILPSPPYLELVVMVIINGAFFLLALSFYTLSEFTRLGLPCEKTDLITDGIYSLSRNPMYFAFYLLYLASAIYTLNPAIWITGIISVYVHHSIVKAEEKFLVERFKDSYILYCQNTRRYV